MTIVAEHFDYVVGIDTHARTHTYAIVNTRTGARDGCQTFPVSTAGINRAISWIQRNTSGAILAAVEGTRSYGATITHALTAQNITVIEVQPPRRRQRAGVGKPDEIDATTAAMTVLSHEVSAFLQPRSDGRRAALSVLVASRERIDTQRTRNRNALNALLRQIDLGIDARRALTDPKLKEIGSWRVRSTDTIQQHYARAEAVLLATAIMDADRALHHNKQQLAQLNEQLAPTLQHQFGFGAVTVAGSLSPIHTLAGFILQPPSPRWQA